MGKTEDEGGLAAEESSIANVTDTSSYWPRNRESASKTADLDSLFPFERESR